MKGIKKSLVAGALACAALNAAQAECSPWSYGIKAGLSVSSLCGIEDKVVFKISGNDEKVQNPFFALPFVNGFVHGEYAFTDYIGVELGLGYMKLGGTLLKQDTSSGSGSSPSGSGSSSSNTTSNSASNSVPAFKIASHGLFVPLSLCIYPMGREENEGIFKLFVGPSVYLSMGKPILKYRAPGSNEYKDSTDLDKVELEFFDLGLQAGIGYEFPLGISLEARYGHHFLNRIKDNSSTKPEDQFKTVGSLEEFAKVNNRYFMINAGWNIASLFKA